jgi:2-polyprenyl-3-methyl-5-hydroxy-6-metoxy-1,4-benzoquinol methylase
MRKWNHAQSVKEVVRHVSFKLGAQKVLEDRRAARGFKTSHLTKSTVRERFEEIYRIGVWKFGDDQVALSGTGSELGATASIRTRLPEVLTEIKCQRLLDIGCGDWTWMQQIDLPCEYIGADIVPQVIESNRKYERPGVSFIELNAIEDELPAADVALCREVLFHLSFADGLKLIEKVKHSAKWFIATSDSIWFNSDIKSGDFRMLNLEARPYRLPKPTLVIPDEENVPGRYLGVWPTEAL